MQHATLIDEWLEEAVKQALDEAVPRAAKEAAVIATAEGIKIGKQEGIKERAIESIVRILLFRLSISATQEAIIRQKLNQASRTPFFNVIEEQALQSANFAEFNATLDELLQTQLTNGSVL